VHACNDESAALEMLKITTAMAAYLPCELARLDDKLHYRSPEIWPTWMQVERASAKAEETHI